MRKINFSFFLLIIVFFPFSLIYSQEPDLRKLISDIQKGETEKARILLLSLEKDNPNSSTVKFLRALLTENGTEAAKLYRDVAFAYEENDLKDDALFKLYQYHYSRGEFSESDKYARMLKESFPQSEFVNYLKRENPISSRIQTQQKFEQKLLSDTLAQSTQLTNVVTQLTNRFSIQVGAFSTESNAKKFASQFTGYTTKIREKESNGKKFYVVLIGEYQNEDDAKIELPKLKNRFNLEGIVVNLQ